jgi:hypothetical protein
VEKSERLKTPREPSNGVEGHFFLSLTSGTIPGSHTEYQRKISRAFSRGKRKGTIFEICQSILSLNGSALRTNYFSPA